MIRFASTNTNYCKNQSHYCDLFNYSKRILLTNPDLATPKNGNAPLDVPNVKRILIIGDPGIGKTSLIKTYLEYSDNKEVTESSRFYLKMYLTKMFFNENIYPTYLVEVPPNLPTPDRIRSYPLVDAVVLCFAIDEVLPASTKPG
ncbi:hypothetical protein TNIN_157571 [Trichonephila inaurata madagascariensis]|uniref:Uncharacterized protein n=1 Tax=Trichonephila inaurata madagascariensis TaxID=2747483 RepID=A0A8X6Y1R5_9ARAC|nr:hypothetical protein TNIN_157571 [Trichonephila inaurata madagascariensis]